MASRPGPLLLRQPLLMLLLLFSVAGCQGYKPLITPSVPELLINEGEELEITCKSINEINIIYPEDKRDLDIATSEHEVIPGDPTEGSIKLKFRRKETVYGDTGWYGCANTNIDVNIKDPDYNDPNVSWIYVYVRSNVSSFVTGDMVSIVGTVGNSIIFPCLPTSPEFHVDLVTDKNEVLELGDDLEFDPKKGFVMNHITAVSSGYYTCRIEQDNTTSEIFILVKVVHSSSVEQPIILTDGIQHVTKGSTLHVKCTVKIGVDDNHFFEWTTPRNSSSRTILPVVQKRINADKLLLTSELVENEVTYDDEGEYTCAIRSTTGRKETSHYIHVYDPSIKYINLTSHDEDRHIIVNSSKTVKFTAYFSGYPTPEISWYYSDMKPIMNNSKVQIESTQSSTTLRINTVQLEDMGNYLLQAVNDEKLVNLTFTLEVLVRPLTYIKPVKDFYSPNEQATFSCEVWGHPKSSVYMSYVKCASLTPMQDCETIELQDSRIIDHSPKLQEVITQTTIEMSGKINCTACNTYGCDTSEVNILVSDGAGNSALGIIEPEGDITVGDKTMIVCAASIYNFSSVQWLDKNQEPIQNSVPGRIKQLFETTNYTYRTNLLIKNVTKADAGIYYCEAKTFERASDIVEFNFMVADPASPSFTEVNMNGTEVVISAREAHDTVILNCHTEGMPKPIVEWYKDDKLIESNEHQFTVFNDQNRHTLVIKYLMEKDSGVYSCIANNRFGKITASQKFIVKGPEISNVWIISMAILVITLIILVITFCIKIRREKRMRKQLIEAGLMHFEEGALDCINPELTVDDQAELLPYDRKWEFPRDKLKLGKQLGSGAFGVVMKAEAQGIVADETVTTVAVKMVRRNAEPAYIRALASELKIMVHLGKHLNVVNLLGACTNNIAKRELLVIVEYCRYGNLHNYLLRHRDNFINQIDPSTGKIDPSIGKDLLLRSTSIGSNNRVKYAALSFSHSLSAASGNSAPGTETIVYCTDTQDMIGLPEGASCINSNGSQPGWRSNYRGDYKDRNLKPICTQDLLSWAFQVSRGMEYLCQRKVLHGDLAARNILLAENNVVKICDFGLAKSMYKDDNYQKKGDGPVPIKWMAIESIRDRVFSTQSDIWSFGIVLWEFFTLAETPYPSMQAEIQYQKLVEGYRMEQPKYATEAIYNIMLQCWKAKPVLRPTFSELVDDIGELLEEGVKMHYVELNAPYLDMNTANHEENNDYLTMMSAPDHAALVSPHHDYVNAPSKPLDSSSLNTPHDESGIFSPRPSSSQDGSRFHFPNSPSSSLAAHSDGEDAPMLKKLAPKEEPEQDEDNYLKPIDVHKKREEFMKQREAERRKERERSGRISTDRDSGYCNTPKGLELVDVKVEDPGSKKQNWRGVDSIGNKSPVILRTQDNYVNLPQKSNEYRKDVPDSFTNPSYIFVESNKSNDQDIL